MATTAALAGVGVRLRPLSAADIETVRLWRNLDDVRRWFRHAELISAGQQERWFSDYNARGDDFAWIVETQEPARAVGFLSLYHVDREHGEGELGRVIAAPEARGTGCMLSASRSVIRHAFDDLGLRALHLEVFAENTPALRLYRQCGFRVSDDSHPLIQMRLERSAPEALRPISPPHPARTVWLASYPKSGNTWLRLFLANLLYPEQAPVNINAPPLRTPISAPRPEFDSRMGVPSAFLLPAEINRLRPAADRLIAADCSEPMLLRKAHDAWTCLPDGEPLMGQAPDYAAIYLIRDPLDVAVSAAGHWKKTPDEAAAILLQPDATLAPSRSRLSPQLPQETLSWEEHVRSWMSAPMAIHVLHYEEMHRQPLKSFRAAIRFLGYDHDDAAVTAALDATSFERLQQQEQQSGFREAAPGQRFFRAGRSGEGSSLLNAEHLNALTAARDSVAPRLQARGF